MILSVKDCKRCFDMLKENDVFKLLLTSTPN